MVPGVLFVIFFMFMGGAVVYGIANDNRNGDLPADIRAWLRVRRPAAVLLQPAARAVGPAGDLAAHRHPRAASRARLPRLPARRQPAPAA